MVRHAAAAYIGVAQNTLRKWAARGPKVGGKALAYRASANRLAHARLLTATVVCFGGPGHCLSAVLLAAGLHS